MSVKKMLFILSSTIILTSRFWGVNTNYIIRYSLMAIWDLYIVLSYFAFRRPNERRRVIKTNFKLMITPYIVFCVYTIFLWMIKSNANFGNFTRLCSTLLYLVLSYGYACTAIYLFREKGIDHLFWAGVLSYSCGSILYLLVNYGVSGVNAYMSSLIHGVDSVANYAMEVHDLTFSMGLFFLYYFFFEEKSKKNHKTKIVVSIILILLGLKRIEVLALFVTICLYFVLIKWGKGIKARAFICGTGSVLVSLGYVFIIKSGILSVLTMKYGIEDSGRLSYYLYANQFYEFSPSYMGTGWTWFNKYVYQLYLSKFRIDGHRIAASIHSDILVMFIEIGFILFVFWVLYMFMARPVVLSKKFGVLTGECALLLTLYMFVLYLTDNTMGYPDTQMLFILVPMTVALKNKETNSTITKYFNANSGL